MCQLKRAQLPGEPTLCVFGNANNCFEGWFYLRQTATTMQSCCNPDVKSDLTPSVLEMALNYRWWLSSLFPRQLLRTLTGNLPSASLVLSCRWPCDWLLFKSKGSDSLHVSRKLIFQLKRRKRQIKKKKIKKKIKKMKRQIIKIMKNETKSNKNVSLNSDHLYMNCENFVTIHLAALCVPLLVDMVSQKEITCNLKDDKERKRQLEVISPAICLAAILLREKKKITMTTVSRPVISRSGLASAWLPASAGN